MRKIDRLRAERRQPERPLPRRVPVPSRLIATMLGKPGFPSVGRTDVPPTTPGTRRDVRRKHEAVAYVAANVKPPTRFYGGCGAGDFTAEPLRDTEEEARADVAEHLVEVSRQPHIAFVTMVPERPRGYLGFCLAGDFSPGLVRASRAEAEADVAPHLLEIGRGLIVRDELPGGVTDAQLASRLNTHGGFGEPVDARPAGQQP